MLVTNLGLSCTSNNEQFFQVFHFLRNFHACESSSVNNDKQCKQCIVSFWGIGMVDFFNE